MGMLIYSSPKVYHNCFSKLKQKCLVKSSNLKFEILTLSFLSDVMVTKETNRICAGLKSTVIKILNDES